MKTQLYQPSAQPWKPRKYQKVAVKFLLEHACAGLLLKPGLGKTSSTLAALVYLKKLGMLGKVLLVAPLRPCYVVWPREIKKWQDFNGLTYSIAHGPDKEEALQADVDIVLINPEGLDYMLGVEKSDATRMAKDRRTGEVHEMKTKKLTVDKKRFKSFGFDMLIIDELSKFKNHQTLRFKAMKEVLDTFGRRWGLTGSPAPNGLLDLFGQCFILDMGNALGPYVTHYRDTYFDADKYGYTYKLKPGAEERIYERISPLMLQMGYEHLDMPELIQNNIFVQLPPSVREIYDQLEDDFITAIDSRLVTAATAAAASSKIRQVANGGVFLDAEIQASGLRLPKSKREWVNLHNEKANALRDLVDELQGDPILVAYDFEHDLDRLRSSFKDGVFACDYNMKEFTKLEEKWNRGEIPLLFGHPQSIGHGNNLQDAAQHVGWYAMTWNRELYDQFIGRVWRQGNKFKQVFVHHFLAEGTIDEVMLNAMALKGNVEQNLFDGLKALAKQRRSK